MAYLRLKRIKKHEYAYLVESKWKKTKESSDQKVRKYLGRVYDFDIVENKEFFDFNDKAEYNSNKDIIQELLKWELGIRRFKENNDKLIRDKIKLDLNNFEIDFKKKKGVIRMNEGFLCEYTLKKLFNFKLIGSNDDYRLANSFVAAGLRIPKELFVVYWENVIK